MTDRYVHISMFRHIATSMSDIDMIAMECMDVVLSPELALSTCFVLIVNTGQKYKAQKHVEI